MSDNGIILDYTLMDLPTAQYKAGLAGLVLHIRNLEKREIEPRPVIEELSAYKARIRFTKESLQCLFDDLCDSVWTETKRKSSYTNKPPKREEKSVVKMEKKRSFIFMMNFSHQVMCSVIIFRRVKAAPG